MHVVHSVGFRIVLVLGRHALHNLIYQSCLPQRLSKSINVTYIEIVYIIMHTYCRFSRTAEKYNIKFIRRQPADEYNNLASIFFNWQIYSAMWT